MSTVVIDKGLVSQFVALTKPRVVSLVVFCAVIGMFLAAPGMVPLQILLGGNGGDRAGRRRPRR
jgi:heme O synthase-like polyprenyltransferase